jgi:thioredoxin reductase (NADPH)
VTLVVRAAALETGCRTTGCGGRRWEGHLQQLVLRETASGNEATVAADALFVLIGARPHTGWLPREIARDRHGFLLTGEDIPADRSWPLERAPLTLETSLPGVLALGDVRYGSIKRVASAVGEGSVAIQLVHNLFDDERWHPDAEQRRTPVAT